jgi:hypothetical protein
MDVRPTWLAAGGRLGGQGGDLGQVVGEDSVSGPDPGVFGAVDHAAVPSLLVDARAYPTSSSIIRPR